MEFPILNLLRDLNRDLGPLLKQLGVRPKISPTGSSYKVTFEAPDGSFSPVELSLTREAIAGGAWDQSSMYVGGFNRVDFGDSGWMAHVMEGGGVTRGLPQDRSDAMAIVRQEIEDLGIVQLEPNKPFYISDERFASLFNVVARSVGGHNKFGCERGRANVLSFSFTDEQEKQWRIAFEGGKARIYIDRTFAAAFPQSAFYPVADFIVSRLHEPKAVVARGPEI